jgi:hypothetical protein
MTRRPPRAPAPGAEQSRPRGRPRGRPRIVNIIRENVMLHRFAVLALLVVLPPAVRAQIEPETLHTLGARGPIRMVVTRSQESTDSLLFDRQGRLIEELRTEPGSEVPSLVHIRYEYDSSSRLRRMIRLSDTAAGAVIECSYDAEGRRRCEALYTMTPRRRLTSATYFTYKHGERVGSISVVNYASDGTRHDSGIASVTTRIDRNEERGWIRTAGGRGAGAEVCYRDARGVLRRRVLGLENAPTNVDDYDSLGFPVGMFRWTSSGRGVAYYFANDTAGNPLRRTMGYVDGYTEYRKRNIDSRIETEFVYTVDSLGNWTRREERTLSRDERPVESFQAQTLEVKEREILYWKE